MKKWKALPHADYVPVYEVPAPSWLELYRCLNCGRLLYLGQVQSNAEAARFVQRFLPGSRFRLILRAAGEIFMEFSLRSSFGGPVQRIVYAAMLQRKETPP